MKPSPHYGTITIYLFFKVFFKNVLRLIFNVVLRINLINQLVSKSVTLDKLTGLILVVGHWDSWWLCLWCWDHRQFQQQGNLSQTTETAIIWLFPVLQGEFVDNTVKILIHCSSLIFNIMLLRSIWTTPAHSGQTTASADSNTVLWNRAHRWALQSSFRWFCLEGFCLWLVDWKGSFLCRVKYQRALNPAVIRY